MKNHILFTGIVFFSFYHTGCKPGAEKKYFTGTIEYTYTYSSDSLNADSLTALRPVKSFFRFDENNYQSRFINRDTITCYYSGILNKCLLQMGSTQQYECEDYGAFTDSVLSYKLYDTDEKILGFSCRVLEIQKRNSWLQYYVSTGLVIAPATYRKHQSYNWDFYGEKAGGGLILKSTHRFKYFTMYGLAAIIDKRDGNFNALEVDEGLFTRICKN